MTEKLVIRRPPERSRSFSPVVELRRYTLHNGRREDLIRIFDGYFIESQEEAGMDVIGQFRDLDWPDCFVWLRGFDDMVSRKAALETFYGGPDWAAHKDAANATMIDYSDVLLLKPAWAGSAFDLTDRVRDELRNLASFAVLSAVIFHIAPETEAEFVALMAEEAAPLLAQHNGAPIAAFVTEHAENTFPRLPVREEANVFVFFQRFADALAHARHEAALEADLAWTQDLLPRLKRHFTQPSERLRLAPTARSLL